MPKTSSKKTLRMKLSAQIRDEVHFTPDQIRKKRTSFVIYNEWNQNELTSEEKALLWDAMFRYNTTGEEPATETLENRFIKLIWLNMKRVFDQNLVNYGAKVKQSEINNRVSHLLAQMEKGEVLEDCKSSNDMFLFESESGHDGAKTGHMESESAQIGSNMGHDPDPVPVSEPGPKNNPNPRSDSDLAAETALSDLEQKIGAIPSSARSTVIHFITDYGLDQVADELKTHPLKDGDNITQALVDMKNRLSATSDEKMGELLHLPSTKAIG